MSDTFEHLLPTLLHLLHVIFVEFIIVCLDCTFQLLLVLFILSEFVGNVLFLLFLALVKLSDPSLVIYVAQASPTQIPTRFKIVVLLGLRLN